jgi:hypothetical protein
MNERHFGFSTPNKDIQDAFANLQKELSSKKANWEAQRSMWASFESKLEAAVNSVTKVQDDKLTDVMVLGLLTMLGTQTCQLGIEITETRTGQASLEKSIKELKLLAK